MSKLRTAGELRGFLADVLADIRQGHVDTNKANAIAKIAAQINASLQVEVTTALQLEKMGGGKAVAGSMVIATHEMESETARQLPKAEPEVERAMEVLDVPLPVPAEKVEPVARAATSKPILPQNPNAHPDRIWCEQCDQSVTVSQALVCGSKFCKAKDEL